jgi:hypothetical protein
LCALVGNYFAPIEFSNIACEVIRTPSFERGIDADYELSNCWKPLLASYLRFLLINSSEVFLTKDNEENEGFLSKSKPVPVGGRLAAVRRNESCQTQFAGKSMFA